MDLYFSKVTQVYCRIRPSLKEYKTEWKSSKSELQFHEFLGLTESQHNLLITEEDLFFRLMRNYTNLIRNPKLTFIDGIPHRTRRGKLVPLNIEWLGQYPSSYTMRKRLSQMTTKLKNGRNRCKS